MPYVVCKRLEYRGQWLDPGDDLPEPGRPKRVLITTGKIRWVSPPGTAYEPDPLTQKETDRAIDHRFKPDPVYVAPPPPPEPEKPLSLEPEQPSPFVAAPSPEEVAEREREWLRDAEEDRKAEIEEMEAEDLEEVDPDEATSDVFLIDSGDADTVGLLVDDTPSGVEQLEACVAHTHEDTGSSPVPATMYDVFLIESGDADTIVKVVRELRDSLAISIKAASELTDNRPSVIAQSVDQDTALNLGQRLEAAGAIVEIVESPEAPPKPSLKPARKKTKKKAQRRSKKRG